MASYAFCHPVSEQESQVLGHEELRNIPETEELFDL